MTPAVFIPGTLCDARVFAPMLGRLDMTAVHAPPIDHDNVMEAAAAILAVAPKQFVAVGFSLGGFVVLELLRQAADRLVGAVLIASNAHPPLPDMAEARRAEVAVAREAGMATLIDGLWPRYVAPGRIGDMALKQIVVDMAQGVGVARFAKQAELAITRPDSSAIVQASNLPLLALCGTEDAMSSPELCDVFAAGPDATVIRMPGVGHFLPLEAPAAAAGAMAAWMRERTSCS